MTSEQLVELIIANDYQNLAAINQQVYQIEEVVDRAKQFFGDLGKRMNHLSENNPYRRHAIAIHETPRANLIEAYQSALETWRNGDRPN